MYDATDHNPTAAEVVAAATSLQEGRNALAAERDVLRIHYGHL